MKKLLLIDCYDSYTDILAQTLEASGECCVRTVKWDMIQFGEFEAYDGVVLSPGPGLPHEYPAIFKALDALKKKPVLGVCMGHQILGLKCGASLKHLGTVYHGLKTGLKICQTDLLFKHVDNGSPLGLYHSWVLDKLPAQLITLAVSDEARIMIIKHESFPWLGFQFHPESYMTEQGKQLLASWLLSF